MWSIEIKPSHRILCLIAEIERFCGAWPRLAQNEQFASERFEVAAQLQALCSIAELEESMPPKVLYAAREYLKEADNCSTQSKLATMLRKQALLGNLYAALQTSGSLNREEFNYLHSLIVSGGQERSRFRLMSSKFHSSDGEMIFPTTAAFLIDSRLDETLEWISTSLEQDELHPLLVIGVAHLLLLQLSPFDEFSHSLCLVILSKQLQAAGYDFVRFAHPVVRFHAEQEHYIAALRQAEKTTGSSWNSLSVWLEFFLVSLSECCTTLENRATRIDRRSRLTSVQQDIVAVVRSHGSASREVIVSNTGINISTVKYNLSLLAAHGVLQRRGGGRSTSYTIA